MSQLLALPLSEVEIYKVTQDITVPQKTLSSVKDRQENASATFYVPPGVTYNTLLLIDDATGSGATFYEIAKQILRKGVAKKVVCFSYTGNVNGFETIREA